MVVDEETKARRFEDGLRFRIKQGDVPFKLTTFRAVVSKALLVEMGLNEAQADRDNNQKKRPRQGEQSSSFQAKNQGTQHVDMKALPKCSRCGRSHADKDCHWNTKTCFLCGQKGHRIAKCPQRKEVQTIPRPTTGQSQGASQKPKIQGRVYTLTQQDANTSNVVVTSIIPVSTTYAYALFDPGATHSFISNNFAKKHNFKFEHMESKLCVDTPVGGVVVTDSVYKSCVFKIAERELLPNLTLLEMWDFNIIFGMDWLATHYAIVDCHRKKWRLPNTILVLPENYFGALFSLEERAPLASCLHGVEPLPLDSLKSGLFRENLSPPLA
ncbi:uncharacterized protein LOC126689609 [Quercus robur]|uniref:uncharacterized protein LOC126689609 n=1 Tax=Quercus robur TaxID=38942 RepID=UPI0021627FF5|nr:uncharacterized protein LOC126689609 [Quercus robur]